MQSLRLAIGFLTIVPAGPRGVPPTGPARSYFPLVGLALGGVLAGLDIALGQVLPRMVVGAVLLIAMLVLTRGLHTEGFPGCVRWAAWRVPSIGAAEDLKGYACRGVRGHRRNEPAAAQMDPPSKRSRHGEDRPAGIVPVHVAPGHGPCYGRLHVRSQAGDRQFLSGWRSRWQLVLALATALAAGGMLGASVGLFWRALQSACRWGWDGRLRV